ncbi:hypothetical protein ABZ172_11755 [Streptomyces sp. NPDC006296]|uniref:hypothetical protein n=1 Tax=Streptomyces sp. NPDC006296 TaxID=3156746 RepID=UPI0033A0501E
MAEHEQDAGGGRGRRRVRAVLHAVLVAATAAAAGAAFARSGSPLPLVVGGLLLVVLGTAWGLRANRTLARSAGVSPGSLRALGRRIRREEVPDDPRERAAMGRVLNRQRRSVERVVRLLWVCRLLAVCLGLSALVQFLDGRVLTGAITLAGCALQCGVPALTRRSSARIGRMEARLGQPHAGT